MRKMFCAVMLVGSVLLLGAIVTAQEATRPAFPPVEGMGSMMGMGMMGQGGVPTTHTIFITGMEVKGSTTADKLPPPSVNPKDLSKGYGFKAPGEADKSDQKKWEVSSYVFTPGFVTVRQGDTVRLTTFMVNGDEHEVWIAAPDGQRAVAATRWNRGREYAIQFVAEKAGTYQLVCSEHAPSMIATFLVLPRK